MFFDTTLLYADTEIVTITEGDFTYLQLHLLPGIGIPVGNSVMTMQIGRYRIPFIKAGAIETANEMLKQANEIPDPTPESKPDILVAKSLQGIEEIAKMDQNLKGKS